MLFRSIAIKAFVLAAATVATADVALAASLKTAIAECEPGAAAQLPENQKVGPRDTQLTLPGVVTVSAYETKCLMNKLGKELIVVAAVDDERKLPGAIPMRWAAGSAAEVQETLAGELAKLTKGNKSRPLLVYCHHAACWLSPKVAERMVAAGYAHVYWLRSGMVGWEKADLAFAGEVEKDPAAAYAEEVAYCDAEIDAESIADIVLSTPQDQVEARIASELTWEQQDRKECLQKIMPKITDGKKRKADLAQRIARSDAEVANAMKSARMAFNMNPAAELVPALKAVPASDLRTTLARASSVQPLTSRCGYFQFSMPRNNPEIADMNRRLTSYYACMDQLNQENRLKVLHVDQFRRAVELAQRTQPYTCSATLRRANCVPDDVWSQVGNVATRGQLQMVESAERMLAQLPRDVDRMFSQLNAHVAAVDANTDQVNDRRERQNNSYGGYTGGYSSPEPVPYRQPSNTSAAGIR